MTLLQASNESITQDKRILTFKKSTDYFDNVINVELALAGFSLENQYNIEYIVDIRYLPGVF